jgi:multiple sugar transport system substrate-binding protein
MLRLGEHGGKQYQLPLAADISAVYLNRALFAETGLDAQKAPETWAAYVEQARKLVRPPERWGSYLGGSYAFTFLPWVWANGGDLFNADGTRCVFDSPPAVEALQLWVDLNQKWQVSPEENRTGAAHNATEMFTGGRVAMWMAGNTALPTYRRTAPGLDFGTALIPRPTAAGKHGAYAGGDTIGLLAGARHVDRAAELLAYVTGEAVQIDYLAREGYIPIRRDLYDNPYARQDPRLLAFTRALDVARTVYSAKWSVVRRPDGPWQTNLDAAMRGQKTPKQAAGDLQREVNAILSSS